VCRFSEQEKRMLIVLVRRFALLCAVLFVAVPLHTLAQERVTELEGGRALVDATGFDGAVLVYDSRQQSWLAAHAQLIDQPFIPASTFKIFSALVALETGVIAGTDSIIPWDGNTRERQEINRDLDLHSAFRLSAVPHFQALVRAIGEQRMQHFIDMTGYGNRDISGGADTFWLTGALRISPRQQIDFLTRLHAGTLPFSVAAMDAVKAMMVNETTPDYTLRAKTGWATLPADSNVGWWVGWVEKGEDVIFFASLLQATAPDDSFGPARLSAARAVLGLLGVLQPAP
jgi:beta-lactamase class D